MEMGDFKSLQQAHNFGARPAYAVQPGEDDEIFHNLEICRKADVGGGEIAFFEDSDAVLGKMEAENTECSRGWGDEAEEDGDGGGLAGSVGSEQAHDFAFLYVERKLFDGGHLAKGFAEGVYVDSQIHEINVKGGSGRATEKGRPAPKRECGWKKEKRKGRNDIWRRMEECAMSFR
jgi:hypothetical protein